MTRLNATITKVLAKFHFDATTGKIHRMYCGPDDKEGPKEYELPLTDSYLSVPFDPSTEWPDFFAEDAEHFYFPVPALPGEQVTVCKTRKASRQLFPLQAIHARHGDEMIHLSFSKQLVLDVGDVVGDGTVTAYWREARIAAVGDSVDMAMVRVGINIVNRLVTAKEDTEGSSYYVRSDLLITKLLHQQGINVAVHCTEVLEDKEQEATVQHGDYTDLSPLLDDPCTNHTLQQTSYDRDKDPDFN